MSDLYNEGVRAPISPRRSECLNPSAASTGGEDPALAEALRVSAAEFDAQQVALASQQSLNTRLAQQVSDTEETERELLEQAILASIHKEESTTSTLINQFEHLGRPCNEGSAEDRELAAAIEQSLIPCHSSDPDRAPIPVRVSEKYELENSDHEDPELAAAIALSRTLLKPASEKTKEGLDSAPDEQQVKQQRPEVIPGSIGNTTCTVTEMPTELSQSTVVTEENSSLPFWAADRAKRMHQLYKKQ